jgi:DNA mismatch repair protein MutS2
MIHLDTLEFSLFKEYMMKGFASSFAKERLKALKPYYSTDKIEKYTGELSEALEYIKMHDIHIPRDMEFVEILPKLNDPLLFLEPDELLVFSEFFTNIREVKRSLLEFGVSKLKLYLSDIHSLSDITDDIDDAVNSKGEIKDSASTKLYNVREELKSVRQQIQKSLAGVFAHSSASKFIQEQVITERNGRFTIPCKTNFKQYVQGIVHDRSASGQTLYVEPSSTVSMNNTQQELMASEREEVVRIMKEIAEKIFENYHNIESTVESYTELAFHLETAIFYKKLPYVFPEISEKVNFKDVHHPIIYLEKGEESVPLDFSMDTTEKTAVITGPNTGGKTAALKSLGLNHILGKCGLPVIGKSAKIINFKNILADIGDKQSLVMDLSTFSAHMVNIRDILKSADSQSLVLLDEAGTGTEPREGAALAVAVCTTLAERGCKSVVTTHFSEMKSYALTEDTAEIYAVDFDYKDFSPKYRLLKGVTGKSDPLVIANRLNFPKDVVKLASSLIDKKKGEAELTLEEISRMQADLEGRVKDFERSLSDLEARKKKVEAREKELREKLAKKETELLEETVRLYNRAKRLADKPGKVKESIKQEIETASNKLKKAKKTVKPVKGVQVGDVIHLEKYDKTGKILEIDGDTARMDMGGLKISIKVKDIVGKKVQEKDKIKDVRVAKEVQPDQRPELLLIGKRVEEALEIVDKRLDDFLLSGSTQLYVIHGRGSGQLRKGVHEFLRTDPRVKSYALASSEEGGEAVTVVKF